MKTPLKKLSFHYVLLLGLSSIWISETLLLFSTNAAPKTSEHRKRMRLYLGGNGGRGTVEGSKFEGWYQRTIQSLSLSEPLVPIQLENSFSSNLGSLGKLNVAFCSKAWESKSLRYIRLISFVGEGYDVFNFMAVPRAGSAIPILGIDVVSLPRELKIDSPLFANFNYPWSVRRSDWITELMPLFTVSMHEVLVSNRAISSTDSSYIEKEGHWLLSTSSHIALIPLFSCKGSTHAFRTSMKDISHSCHKVTDYLSPF